MTSENEDLNLFSLANRNVPSATLLAALMVDPMTARILVAWRKSMHDLETARVAAEAAGETTIWFDVRASTDE